MISEIIIDNNNVVYCTFLNDGRIIKYFLKKEKIMIYVCEECDSTWISIEKIFYKKESRLLIPYIQSLGYTERINPRSWETIAENNGFLTADDVDSAIIKHGIKIIHV